MSRTLSRVVGLAMLGAAGAACWRAWRARRAGSDAPRTVADRPSVDQRPSLTLVPDNLERPTEPVIERSTEPVIERPTEASIEASTWAEPVDGACPAGYPIKANVRSGIYHVPGGLSYDRTIPSRCFATAEAAEAEGFRRAKR